jgi:hypothetical protein
MTILKVEQNEEGNALVTARSGLTGEDHTRTIPISKQALMRGLAEKVGNGLPIQAVFPGLTADDREFLMTGITPGEWDAAFGDDDDSWDEEENDW